jgi:hypothetical protein
MGFPFCRNRLKNLAMMRFSIAAVFCVAIGLGSAQAQLALPGAVAPSAAGSVVKTTHVKKTSSVAPSGAPQTVSAVGNAPNISGVVGRPLLLNGSHGTLQFSAHGNALRIEKLSLAGEVISDPSRQCQVNVVGTAPIETKSLGHPDGLERFSADISACPFSFDVLDGAVLAPAQTTACIFQAADCQASPGGLWGPAPAAQQNAKTLERDRARADSDMNANFRAFNTRVKDPAQLSALTREQGEFSAQRNEVCHEYANEATLGLCAVALTQARAAYLKARFDELPALPAKKPASAKKKR